MLWHYVSRCIRCQLYHYLHSFLRNYRRSFQLHDDFVCDANVEHSKCLRDVHLSKLVLYQKFIRVQNITFISNVYHEVRHLFHYSCVVFIGLFESDDCNICITMFFHRIYICNSIRTDDNNNFHHLRTVLIFCPVPKCLFPFVIRWAESSHKALFHIFSPNNNNNKMNTTGCIFVVLSIAAIANAELVCPGYGYVHIRRPCTDQCLPRQRQLWGRYEVLFYTNTTMWKSLRPG